MARIKTDIMVWSKAFLSKCKLQKWNFVTKPPHGGPDEKEGIGVPFGRVWG